MKQEIRPGKVLNFLSPEEFLEHHTDQTNSILKALGKNAVFRRVIGNGPITATAIGTNRIAVGPEPGFMWDIRAVASFLPANAGINSGWYINDASTKLNLILAQLTNGGFNTGFGSRTHVLHSGDQLVFQCEAVPVADQGSIHVAVIEVPSAHEAQLLL